MTPIDCLALAGRIDSLEIAAGGTVSDFHMTELKAVSAALHKSADDAAAAAKEADKLGELAVMVPPALAPIEPEPMAVDESFAAKPSRSKKPPSFDL